MNIVVILLSFIFFAIIIKYTPFFRNIENISYKFLIAAFTLKCIVGFIFLLVYNYYYEKSTADIYKYFNDGMIMAGAIKDNPIDFFRMISGIDAGAEHLDKYYAQMTSWFRPWEEPVYNDNRIVIRFNAIIGIISGGNIGIHIISANFLTFTGLLAIYKFAKDKFSSNKLKYVFWGIILFPSVLFWGSGVLKESILLFALGIFLLYTQKIIIIKHIKLIFIFNILISLFLLVLLKAYIGFLLIPVIIAYYIFRNKTDHYIILKYVAIFVLWMLIFMGIGYVFPSYNMLEILANKQNNFVNFTQFVEAGSIITDRLMQANIFSILSFVPSGFWNTLTRPHLLDSDSPIILIAALENLFIWISIIFMAVFYNKEKLFNPFLWFCISFVILTFILVGIVTPIYGGLVRYKIPALPFLWMAFLYLVDFEKIKLLIKKIFV
ncbi:MAG: hypothetical protein ACOCWC_02070 [Bacteroidota bacterium]